MQITIEKIVYPGRSLGRGEDGIAVFTDGALAGEVVELDVIKKKKSFKEGKITAILKGSPLRIIPTCPSFGQCGGCSFQHTSYENQIQIKEGYVKELLKPLDIIVSPLIRSPEQWGYRNKMEFSFFQPNGELMVGLHEKGEFNRYFSVPPCFIADSDFLPIIELVSTFAKSSQLPAYNLKTHRGFYRHLVLRKGKRTGQILVNLVTHKQRDISTDFFAPLVNSLKDRVTSLYWTMNSRISDAVIADEPILVWGKEMIEEQMQIKGRTYTFAISPFSFFQTNTLGGEKLYETVIDALNRRVDDRVLDLYCGTGTIGIVLAPYVKEVLGIEQLPEAVENARDNKQRNKIENVAFEAGSVEKWIKHGTKPDFNCLVLDPPRSGISNKVIDFIEGTKLEQIVYVSCNPATLVRDLKGITEKVSYQIEKAIPIDMFPQTYHVEVVVSLKRM
jgi:23S rRNA (uracil-5-)-methyltransferase RumA